MQTCIATMWDDGYQELADSVLPNLRYYAKTHNYYLSENKITLDNGKFSFKKIDIIQGLLDRFYCILWLDIDTMIMNHHTTIESFLDDNHDFYVCRDINLLNTGTFIIKNTAWSRDFIEFLLEYRKLHHDEQNLIDNFQSGFDKYNKIKVLPHPSINSYVYSEYGDNFGKINGEQKTKPTHEEGNWEKGDFLLHLPGIPPKRRIEIINQLKEQIIL